MPLFSSFSLVFFDALHLKVLIFCFVIERSLSYKEKTDLQVLAQDDIVGSGGNAMIPSSVAICSLAK